MSKQESERKTKTDLTKYIVNVQGKDFITFPGLLAEAHAMGLITIDTTMVNTDLENPVMKATVVMKDNEGKPVSFSGYGDANKSNVATQVAKALIRMAETRAVARALRFACNIDMAALEELDGDNKVIGGESNKPSNKPASKPTKVTKLSAPKTALTKPTIKKEDKADFTRTEEPKFP